MVLRQWVFPQWIVLYCHVLIFFENIFAFFLFIKLASNLKLRRVFHVSNNAAAVHLWWSGRSCVLCLCLLLNITVNIEHLIMQLSF